MTPVSSIAALKQIIGESNSLVTLLGFHHPNDGGGGQFYYDDSATINPNDGTVIKPEGATVGRWIRLYSGQVNVRWFGAKGDSSDDTNAFVSLRQVTSDIYLYGGIYLLNSPIDFQMATIWSEHSAVVKARQIKIGSENINGEYRSRVLNLLLEGTGLVCAETGALYLKNIHKCTLDDVRIENYTTPGCGSPLLVFGSFLCQFNNISVQGNLYGATFKKWINALKVIQGTFANNTNFGLFVQGAIKLSLDTCDFESNGGDGLTISNEDSAEYGDTRGVSIRDCYFEYNAGCDIRVGITGTEDNHLIKKTIIENNFFLGNGSNYPSYAIRLEHSEDAEIVNNDFNGQYTKLIYLGANSLATTIIPFYPDQVEVVIGATVSSRTVQSDIVQLNTNSSGDSAIYISFHVPYNIQTPPLNLSTFSAGNPGVYLGNCQIEELSNIGFKLVLKGSEANISVGVKWTAGI